MLHTLPTPAEVHYSDAPNANKNVNIKCVSVTRYSQLMRKQIINILSGPYPARGSPPQRPSQAY